MLKGLGRAGGLRSAPCVRSFASATRVKRPRGYWDDPDVRRSFWETVARETGVQQSEEWRSVSRAVVSRMGGRGLLKRYGDSVPHAVADAFPELGLNPGEMWCKRPKGHWLVAENCRVALEEVKREAGIEAKSDWKKVVNQDLVRMGHSSMLARHGNSILRLLRFAYPEEEWEEEACRPVRGPNYWAVAANRRAFMDKVAAAYRIEKKEDWRQVNNENIIAQGGATLLRHFNSNVMELLRDVFPGEEWEEREVRPKVTKEYWSSRERRREFLLGLAERKGWARADGVVDWKYLTYSSLREEKGTGLLARYKSSVFDLLRDTFPEQELKEEDCLLRMRSCHWQERENRRSFVLQMAGELGLSQPSDWKAVSLKDVKDRGGSGLLAFYQADMVALLRDVYGGGEEWTEYSCRRNVKAEQWEDTDYVRQFMLHIKRTLRVEDAADWARISAKQLAKHGGGGLLAAMPLSDALRLSFPHENWEDVNFDNAVKKSCQRMMRVGLTRLYPGVAYHEDYRHPCLGGSEDERRALELDIYFPQLQLAFEFNGQQHYHEVGFFGPVEIYRRRDEQKQRLCEEQGIKLVTIPYWWDQRLQSLAASIDEQQEGALPAPKATHEEEVRQLLEEVQAGEHTAVPLSPPKGVQAAQKASSAAGQATHVWDANKDPTGWLAFPRLAGVRAFWTEEGHLATRRGKRLHPPSSWLQQMPTGQALEGDLFAGQEHVGAVLNVLCEGPAWSATDNRLTESQRRSKEEAWSKITFVACDMPGSAPLVGRLEHMRSLPSTDVFSAAEMTVVKSREHLRKVLEAAGNDGLLLRRPDALYRYGRVQEAHRVKLLLTATACMVKKSPLTRALVAETPSGATQVVRCSERVYAAPPPAGTVLSVGHFGLWNKSGRYKYPFLMATLPDERWQPTTA